jgi:AmmeMemoRadiSam system protein A
MRLLAVAADAIGAVLAEAEPEPPIVDDFAPPLRAPAATFVTLEREGRLLGCIGSLDANRPLVSSVAHHAVAAAFRDPRLPAVTADDFESMAIVVSHLGALEAIAVRDRDELAACVQPGHDGLVLDAAGRRATLLPSVWRQVSGVAELLDVLWAKIGLPRRSWPPDTHLLRYATAEFGLEGPRKLRPSAVRQPSEG